MDINKAIKSLLQIKKILDKYDIEYWLDEGSLLGAVRDKRLIEWDKDIDLSVWYTTLPKIIPLPIELTNFVYAYDKKEPVNEVAFDMYVPETFIEKATIKMKAS